MATARKAASTRLQAIRAEAERQQPAVKPLSSYFKGPAKATRQPRRVAKPV